MNSPGMGLVEPFLVTVFKCEIPIGLIARSLFLEILLRHHVQRGGREQRCVTRRLSPRFLANPIRLSLLRGTARVLRVLCRTP